MNACALASLVVDVLTPPFRHSLPSSVQSRGSSVEEREAVRMRVRVTVRKKASTPVMKALGCVLYLSYHHAMENWEEEGPSSSSMSRVSKWVPIGDLYARKLLVLDVLRPPVYLYHSKLART